MIPNESEIQNRKIDYILDKRIVNEKTQYLIKWRNMKEKYNCWMDSEALQIFR